MTDVKQLITEHLDIWLTAETEKKSGRGRSSGASNSIYGVQKLRELILDLAVTGKLSTQLDSDTYADNIISQVNIEKEKLLADGILKKTKIIYPPKSIDFSLPEAWTLAYLGEITLLITDGTHHTPTYLDSGVPFISVKDVNGKTVSFTDCKYISESEHTDLIKRCKPERNDILLCRIGTLGRATLVDTDDEFSIFVSLGLLKVSKKINYAKYLHLYLHSPRALQQFEEIKVGGSHTNKLNLKDLPNILVTLPPIEEQQRIVAKVDELMQLCDQLEQQQSLSTEAHEQLVDVLLNALTNSADADEFQQNWQRISANFDLLFTTDYSIEQLKQTILQLAVMGKLVKQDPSDEPASELLKQIAEEKAKLVKEGKIKKSKPLPEITDDEKPFELPSGWKYTKLADICRPISSGSTPSADKFVQSGIPFLKVYNIRDQKIDFHYKEQFIDDEIHQTKLSRSKLYPNDVVMNIVGPPLGKVAIIPEEYPEWNCNQAIVFFGLLQPELSQYVYTYLCEGSFLKQIELIGTAGQDNISVTKSQNIIMPLPPLKEQKRIVEKVNQLFSIIDQLRVLQAKARQTQLHLADVLVANAVEGA
nr:restriction endonuclease subunit S [Acinetobacter sp. GSS19]